MEKEWMKKVETLPDHPSGTVVLDTRLAQYGVWATAQSRELAC